MAILFALISIGYVTFLLRFLLALGRERKVRFTYQALIVTAVGDREIEPRPFSPRLAKPHPSAGLSSASAVDDPAPAYTLRLHL